MSLSRRRLLQGAAGASLVAAGGPLLAQNAAGPAALPAGTRESATYDTLPGKAPLIKRSWRPPNVETPVRAFSEPFTPNDAFFVRYHLSVIPQVDAAAWRLVVGGEGVQGASGFTLAQLRTEFEQVEVAALCLCSGNRRGFSDPHVPGIQWGNGAMGNARWTGVPLHKVLASPRAPSRSPSTVPTAV